jgi:hypothetical protein
MADSDYVPVMLPDEEEEERRRLGAGALGGYVPPAPPAGNARTPEPSPSGYAPVMPALGSTEDLESRAAEPRRRVQDAMETAPPAASRPSWKDFAPPEPHGWSRFGHDVAALFPRTNRVFNEMPEKRAVEAYRNATAEYEAPQIEAQRRAQTGEAEARAGSEEARSELEHEQAEALRHPKEQWEPVPTLVGPNGEPVEFNKAPGGGYRYGQLPGGVKSVKQPGETQEQNKLAYQGIVQKLDAAGLPTGPKEIDKSLDAALKKGAITPQEHASAKSYEAANQTPGTNLTVHVAGQEEGNRLAINKMFEGKEVIAHTPDGRRVQMSYADAQAQGIPPERLVALSGKEADELREKSAQTNATFQSINTYRTDFKNAAPQLTPKDRDAMRVLTSHVQDGRMAGVLGGLIEDLPLVGPLNTYANKLLEGTMTTDQYNQLSPSGKKLVSDYFSAIIANFANMKAMMGSVGRNPMQLQAEINTIPLPFLDWQSASDQFENKRDDIKRRAASQPELYKPAGH